MSTTLERTSYDPGVADPSVICTVCTGQHLARYCPRLAADLAALVDLALKPPPEHGTMAQAQRERRAGGNRNLCPACRVTWDADQARHRANRRARARGGRP